jgi:hypothetical protein
MTTQLPVSIGTATEVCPDRTIRYFTKHVFDERPYPTQSRGMQFYRDPELYLEMDEELARRKDPPTAGVTSESQEGP